MYGGGCKCGYEESVVIGTGRGRSQVEGRGFGKRSEGLKGRR